MILPTELWAAVGAVALAAGTAYVYSTATILLGGTVAFSGPGATLRARLRRRARALFVPQSGNNTRSE